MIVTFGSCRHAPGVSTTVMAVAAALGSRGGLVSGDPDGSDWAVQLGCGIEAGLVGLSLASRRGHLDLIDITAASATTPSGAVLVPGPLAGDEAAMTIGMCAARVAGALARDPDRVWVVDAGRVSLRSLAAPFATGSQMTVLLARGSVVGLQPVADRVSTLANAGWPVAFATIGSTGYSRSEIEAFVGCPTLPGIPDEPNATRWAIDALNGIISRPARRSAWWMAIGRLAEALASAPRMADVAVPA